MASVVGSTITREGSTRDKVRNGASVRGKRESIVSIIVGGRLYFLWCLHLPSTVSDKCVEVGRVPCLSEKTYERKIETKSSRT